MFANILRAGNFERKALSPTDQDAMKTEYLYSTLLAMYSGNMKLIFVRLYMSELSVSLN